MNYGSNMEPGLLTGFQLKDLIDKWGDLSHKMLFMSRFGKLPSTHTFVEVDLKKFHSEFPSRYQEKIMGFYYEKNSGREDWKDEYIYVLQNEII
ncbi:hypothetical protein, partial [Longispora fulva]